MNLDPVTLLILKFLAVVVLVALNGFFVAAEFALVKIRDTQLDKLVLEGRWRAKVARRVLANLDRTLSAAQLGITLASLALGWVGEPVFAALLAPVMEWMQVDSEQVRHTVAVIVGFTAITFLHITAGEQAPKWLAMWTLPKPRVSRRPCKRSREKASSRHTMPGRTPSGSAASRLTMPSSSPTTLGKAANPGTPRATPRPASLPVASAGAGGASLSRAARAKATMRKRSMSQWSPSQSAASGT